MYFLIKKLTLLIFLLGFALSFAQAENTETNPQINFTLSYLEDPDGQLDFKDIKNREFTLLDSQSPNYGLTNSVYWFKIDLHNPTDASKLLLKIQNATISSTTFYSTYNQNLYIQSIRNTSPYHLRKINSQYPLFNINLSPNSSTTCYLKVSSINVLDLPIDIGITLDILSDASDDQMVFGLYAGIIIVMFLYNIFIYITVRDINYLYYVFYILVVGLTQACLKGYAAKFLWPENAWLIEYAPHIITVLSGVFSILFTFNFLQVTRYAKWAYYVLSLGIVIYALSIITYLAGEYILAQQILQGTTGIVSLTILACGFYTYAKGYKPALFFIVSWSFFLTGVVIYILKDSNVLPYNFFTSNAILIGSALEVAILSFALADKINIYKKEKEQSQEQTLLALQENERIIREQNIILEAKVNERTQELTASNEDLNKALTDLKEAEIQLVESEKMASLGQLTAGIAHEINNPVNFITSNVSPLKRDVVMLLDAIKTIEEISLSSDAVDEKQRLIDDYKEEIDFDYLKIEIDHLLNGIHNGASRTAEIVKGLRVFSRLDEDDIKKADINEGIESTLVIVNNLLNNKIKLIKNYGELPQIECYPGKLNQVFLNIISNAIYAINKRHGDSKDGELKISTESEGQFLLVKIEDNGTGMDENTKKKIFEPFFTTKDVGDGTGLGMSIVYNTIQRHEGKISVNSTPGVGTEFIIELPIRQS
jgi:signal transduction histidine kinase